MLQSGPSFAGSPPRCRSRARAPAATLPPSPASWRGTAVAHRSQASFVCPVTDCGFDRLSYTDHATGYLLTRSLIVWFRDIYRLPADRTDPHGSPLHGKLKALPPALVVTCGRSTA